MKLEYAGYYQFETFRVDADGNEIEGSRQVKLPWFPNLITDSGLDQLSLSGFSDLDRMAYARIGTSNTTPSFGDTALGAQVAATSGWGSVYEEGVGPDSLYLYRRVSKRFNANTAAGVNLAEVAIASGPSNDVFSRALLTDSEGSPTTINLDPLEVLDVIYELRLYVDTSDVVVNTTVDGVPTTVTMRPNGFPSATYWVNCAGNIANQMAPYIMGSFADQPALGSTPDNNSQEFNVTWATYVPGSFQRVATITFGLGAHNYTGGLGCVYLRSNAQTSPAIYRGAAGYWSWGFSPKLNKNASRTATITLGISWGRYTP